MTSVFIYTILACSIFWIVYSGRIKHGYSGYSFAELIPFWLLMRLCPFMMLKTKAAGNITALIVDTVILILIYIITARLKRNPREAAALYMFCPLPAMCIAIGTARTTIINAATAVVAVLLVILALKKFKIISPSVFLKGYIAACTGSFFIMYALYCQFVSFSDIFKGGKPPVMLIAGLVCVAAGIVLFFIKAFSGGKTPEKKTESSLQSQKTSHPSETTSGEKFGIKNIIHLAVLTAVYAAAVVFQLGSHEAPKTGVCFNSDNSELIIDLGEYTTVSKIDFFLGQESLRSISFSAYNEVDKEWMSIKTEELKTAFAWNSVDIAWSVRYIGLVFGSSDTHVNEIVILDNEGNRITPADTSRAPELFDEQDMHPEYPTYYYRMMFDEIYHGRTAYEFLNDLTIYENTHPPLGKTLISIGIALFGMNPFGWRIVCAVLGTAMVPVMYLFAWKLSHRSDTALTGGILMATEFMHFTLSRIATIDIIVAQFILMMFFFMFCFVQEMQQEGKFSKQILWLLLSGISTGLAISTKWTGLYAAAGLAVIFFTFLLKHCLSEGKKLKESSKYLTKLCIVCVISFIIIPLSFYCLSYIEFVQSYPDKNIIQHAIENAQSMLSYHSGIRDSHPYESPWYSWIIDQKSLLDAITVMDDGKISSLATFGNPLVFIAGFAAFVYNVYLWKVKEDKPAQFLSIAYLSMLMPWLFIHRTVFIYQYFGCVIIMVMLICNSLIQMKRRIKTTETIMVIASVLLFVMFFPEISGITVDREYTDKVLEWLPTWVFE